MSFIISKIVWFVISPLSVIILCLLLSAVLLVKYPRCARVLFSVGLIFLLVFSLPFFPRFFIRQIEAKVLPAKVVGSIDGVIVLGGMINISACRQGRIELFGSADRIIEAVVLLNKFPKAQLVLTGGSGSLDQSQNLREADYLRILAMSLNIDSKRIVVERDSRATYEHPKYLEKIIDKNKRWVLVTSAAHMPRALGCFKKYGFNVLPYPVDYQGYPVSAKGVSFMDFIPAVDNLFIMDEVMHEWYGLIYYRMMGYIKGDK
jgi:uncharacterized SAM-binding protein YcdF (DUF218 family)